MPARFRRERTRPTSAMVLAPAALALLLLAGCETKAKKTTPPADEVKHRETIGKKTQNVLDLQAALQEGGVLAETTIPVSDPLTQSAAAYRTSVGKISVMSVEHAIQIRNAQSIDNPKPLTHAELMAEIIKKDQPDGIMLPQLPYYQEYAWDEAGQSLVVVEFPAKKEQFQKQQDEKLGRD